MNQSYKTKFGNIKIQEEKILISDNSKNQFLIVELIVLINVMTSLIFIFSHGIQFDFKSYIWAFIGASSIIILLALLRFTHKKELKTDEINSIKYRKRFGNQTLSFRLKNSRIRRVYLLNNKQQNQSLLINLKNTFNLEP